MLYYKIVPKCSPGLFLTLNLDPTNSAVIMDDLAQEKDKDRQLWAPVEIVNGSDDKGFALLNKYAGKVISARGERQPMTQISIKDAFASKVATWKFLPVQDGGALQLPADTDMNLNVFGDGPYLSGNTVGIHDWKGGEPNEVWKLIPVED